MKIAVFSDIHSNLFAFKAALADAIKCGITDYFFLGDLITDMPWANEIYDIIRKLNNVKIIRGNRERMLLALNDSDEMHKYNQMASIYWTRREISEENIQYISTLPDELSFELDGTYFYLNHRPEDIWGEQVSDRLHYFANRTDTHSDYTSIMTSAVKNLPDVAGLSQGIYLYGHFHGQWYCRLGETIIINPGSCGVAGDNETLAEYCILSNQNGNWNIDERLVKYDREETLKQFRSSRIYQASPIWSEAVAMTLETGLENLHLLFAHLDNSCSERGMNPPYSPYANDLWDTEGRRWVEAYKKQLITMK